MTRRCELRVTAQKTCIFGAAAGLPHCHPIAGVHARSTAAPRQWGLMMNQENHEYNKFLLSSPLIVSAAFAGLLDKGKPLGMVMNMRLSHSTLPNNYCEPIVIHINIMNELRKSLRSILSPDRHPDHRPEVLGEVPGVTVPSDHPLRNYVNQLPPTVMDDAVKDQSKQWMRFCHLHDFRDLFVFEFVSIDGTTRPFCMESTVAHPFLETIDLVAHTLEKGARR